MPSLILIAYHFPPETAIGAARPYRFYKYLKRLGYTVHVITASVQGRDADPDVEYIGDPFFSDVRDAGWQVERAVRKFFLPGVLGMRWAHLVMAAGLRFLKKSGGEAWVLSTSPPFGTHYAGWRLARAAKIPWVADFRDPFGGVSLEMGGLNGFHKVLFNWLEKRVIHSADLVIANTDSMAEVWKRQHPARASHIHLLWNGFDPESPMPAKPIPSRSYKVLSHVGELYAGRTVTPVLEAIGRLVAAGATTAGELKVRIIGPATPTSIPNEGFIRQAQGEGWLELSTTGIKQQEAREIAQTSDYLLLLQPQSAVQVPGKLYEYLQIGRPILAFVMRESPVERILKQAGVPYRCVYADTTAEEFDSAVLEFLRLPTNPTVTSAWFQETFQAANQARYLTGLLGSGKTGL